MSEGVVDLLESVHVHEEQHHWFSCSMTDDDGLTEPIIEQHSVRQARKRIVERLVFERVLLRSLGGDVVQDPHKAPFPAEEHFAGAELHGEDRPVLALAPQFARPGYRSRALSGSEVVVEVTDKIATIRLCNEHLRVLAPHLNQRVAEEPLGRPVEEFDHPALVGADDSVGHVVENASHMLSRHLHDSLCASSLDEPAELTSKLLHHGEEIRAGLGDGAAVEVHDADDVAAIQDGKAEGTALASVSGRRRRADVWIAGGVDDPYGLPSGTYLARQVAFLVRGYRVGNVGAHLRREPMPEVLQAEDIVFAIPDPQLSDLPAKFLAEPLQKCAGGGLQRLGFDQHVR